VVSNALLNPLAKVTVANTTALGDPSPTSTQLLNASVLSTTGANNAVVAANVASAGQLLGAAINTGSAGAGTSGLGTLVTPVVGAVNGVAPSLSGLVNNVGGTLSNATNGQVSLSLNGTPTTPSGGGLLGGLLGGATGGTGTTGGLLSPVTSLVSGLTGGTGTTGVLAPVTGLVSGLSGGATGASGPLGGVLTPVTGLVSGLTGGALPLGTAAATPASGGLLGGVTSGTGVVGGVLKPVTGLVSGLAGGAATGKTGLLGGVLGKL
jgi:hypothetical protein